MDESEFCEECKNTGRVMEKDGTIHPCYKCLAKGKMDQHSTNLKDAKDLGIGF